MITMKKIILLVLLNLMSIPTIASPICGEGADPKNIVTELALKKATLLQKYKTKKEALIGIKEGYIIDLKNSNINFRDDEEFLLFAAEQYPTKYQIAAWRSNCHDKLIKDPQLFKLASNRLKQKETFKVKLKKTKYSKHFKNSIK